MNKDLLNTLTSVAKHKTLPTLQNVAVRYEYMEATDLETSVQVEFASPVKGLVNAKLLKGMGTAQMVANWDNVKSDTDMDEWPALPDNEREMRDLTEGTVRALLEAITSTSTDDSRPVLCAVQLKTKTVASTDGYRLYAMDTDDTSNTDMVIPVAMLNLVKRTKLLKGWTIGYDGYTDEDNRYDSGNIVLENRGITITGKQLSAQYPEWRTLVPSSLPDQITVNVADLKKAGTIIGKPTNISLGVDGVITLTNDEGKTTTSQATYAPATKLDSDEIQIIMPLKDGNQTMLNYRYVIDAAGKSKTVTIMFDNKARIAPTVLVRSK